MGASLSNSSNNNKNKDKKDKKEKQSHYCKIDFEINPDCWMFVNEWDRDWCLDLVKKHTSLGWRKVPVLNALADDFPKENVQFAIVEQQGRQLLAIENVCPRYRDYCVVFNVF